MACTRHSRLQRGLLSTKNNQKRSATNRHRSPVPLNMQIGWGHITMVWPVLAQATQGTPHTCTLVWTVISGQKDPLTPACSTALKWLLLLEAQT